jgi:hypothetical protein
VWPSPPFFFPGGEADATRRALIGDTILFVVKAAGNGASAASCFCDAGVAYNLGPPHSVRIGPLAAIRCD